ncbi:hypothetical protein Tco_0590372 [Tanacetum coccineum]
MHSTDKASSVKDEEFLWVQCSTGMSVFADAEACAFRTLRIMPSLISCRMASKSYDGVSDVDVLWESILSQRCYVWLRLKLYVCIILTPEFVDLSGRCTDFLKRSSDLFIEEEDGEWIRFLGSNSSLGIKKYRGLNNNDGGNTGDGVKIAGGVIGSGDEIAHLRVYATLVPQLAQLPEIDILKVNNNGECKLLRFSSPNRFTSDIEDAFSSMNILNYTSVSSDYFPVSLGSNSFNSSENPNDNMIPPVFLFSTINPVFEGVQAFSCLRNYLCLHQFPITHQLFWHSISGYLPPSLLFHHRYYLFLRYFFVPEELLPPKKQIHSPSSSSTTLSNPSRNQTRNLVSPSSSVYTPTPPQVLDIGKCSIKMHLKHHEEQVEDILNYLDELSFHRIEKMEEGRINGNKLKTELKKIRTQIIKLQKKQLGQKDKIAFAYYRISDLEQIIEKIQARH